MESHAAPFPSIPLLRRGPKSDREDYAGLCMVLTLLICPLSQTGYLSISNNFPQSHCMDFSCYRRRVNMEPF